MGKQKILAYAIFISIAISTLFGEDLKFKEYKKTEIVEPGERFAFIEFVFTNNGEEEIQILKVEASCGCAGFEIPERAIRPGATRAIVALIDLDRKMGYEVRVQLTVFTSESNGGNYSLIGIVPKRAKVKIEPRLLKWKIGDALEEKSVVATIDPPLNSDIDWKIEEAIVMENEVFVASVLPHQNPNTYIISVRPLSTASKSTARIYFKTQPNILDSSVPDLFAFISG